MKRFTRLTSCVVASVVAVGALTTPPAQAYEVPATGSLATVGQVVTGSLVAPVILATMLSSVFGEQCNLFDTRGCHHQ